jgi:hypothetical protein
MAKKNNTMTYIIIALAIGIIGYILMKGQSAEAKISSGGGDGDFNSLPPNCYPFEEVHETSTGSGEMWLSIIPFLADGVTSARPPASATSIGSQVSISNTGSALDGTYTINSIWYDAQNNIGSFRVDVPGGYNFNYNATQGGDPRDMTYFGIGHICII